MHTVIALQNNRREILQKQLKYIFLQELLIPHLNYFFFLWGKVRNENSLFLFYPGSTHNFISVELAQKLGIQTEEFKTEDRGSTIPLVSHASLQKSIKKLLFAYMIFVNEPLSSKESYAKIDQEDQMKLLKEFKDCFSIAK